MTRERPDRGEPARPNAPSPSRGGPFDRLRPVALVAAGYALACAVWVMFGTHLPGGRWFAVHLFTLGLLTNLVLGLADHFSRTLTHQPGSMPVWQLPAANAGILGVLWGVPSDITWAVVAGATLLTAVVLLSYRRLRTMRRKALAPRFGWVVRSYERAHGAFVHGALLGALIGASVFAGAWYSSARIAHAHIQLLGWGGMTLLATIAFFGPTVGRTRIVPGADARAAGALRLGATALTVAVLSLLLSGAAGGVGVAFRIVAAAGLAVVAWSVTVVCVPVVREMRASQSPGRWGVLAVAAWFPLVVWADAIVVATGSWRWLDALGASLILGVLAQAIASSLGYLSPQLRPWGAERDATRHRVETSALVRAIAWNVGALLVFMAAAAGPGAFWAWPARLGWGLVLASAFVQAIAIGSVRRASVPS